jgi:hypothetical protein
MLELGACTRTKAVQDINRVSIYAEIYDCSLEVEPICTRACHWSCWLEDELGVGLL